MVLVSDYLSTQLAALSQQRDELLLILQQSEIRDARFHHVLPGVGFVGSASNDVAEGFNELGDIGYHTFIETVASQAFYLQSDLILNVSHQVLPSRRPQRDKIVQVNGLFLASIMPAALVRQIVDVTEERNHRLWVVFVELNFLRVTLLHLVN